MTDPQAKVAGNHAATPAADAPALARFDGWLPLLAIGALALVIRLIYLVEIYRGPLPGLLMGDALSYDTWARSLAAGHWIGTGVFYQAPLYPYFLGVIYLLAGHSLLAVRLVQVALGASACVMLAAAGRQAISVRAGVIAGLLLALWPSAIFFDCLIQKSALDLPLLCLLLLLMGRAAGGKGVCRVGSGVAMGLTLGAFMLTRENASVLVAMVLVWMLLGFPRQPWPRRGLWAAAMFVGLAAVLLPVAIRNQVVGGEFHLTTSQLGPNLYIGNNPKADGTYRALHKGHGDAKYERADATQLAQAAVGRQLTPQEVSSYWVGQVVRYVRTEPASWLRLMGRKTMLVWNRVELGDTEDIYTYGRTSHLLRFLQFFLHFGTLVPLAAAGLVLAWPLRRRLWWIYLLTGAYVASVVAFYVFARYRFPLVPLLILLTAAGVDALIAAVSERRAWRWPTISLLAGAVILAAVVANWPMVPVDSIRATTEMNIGVYLMGQQDQAPLAIDHLRQSLQLVPSSAETHGNLASALARQRRVGEAVAEYRLALSLRPDVAETNFNLGILLAGQHQDADALPYLRAAAKLNPDSAEAYYSLGRSLAALGQLDKALVQYGLALKITPDDSRLHNNMGVALARLRRLPEARAEFQRAVDLDPGNGEARQNLAQAVAALGQVAP